MAVQFPPLRPTDRRFRPGTVPQTVARTVNGRTVRRPLANKQGGSQVELTYQNIPDSDVELLRQAHKAAKGRYEPLDLPPEVWAGDPDLEAFVAFMPQNTAWRFSGEIEVRWAKRGRATATVRLVNYMRTVLPILEPPIIEPPNPPVVLEYGFCVSETITAGAALTLSSGISHARTVVTRAGSIYFGGVAAVGGANKYFLMKYDKDLNLLWAKWLETTNTGIFQPDFRVALAEGPTDGVFLIGWGPEPTQNSPQQAGASMRVHLFNESGNLINTAAWQVSQNPTTNQYVDRRDYLESALYVPTQNLLYVKGGSHLLTVMRALTLDQPYSTDIGSLSQYRNYRVFWLESKQRILVVGDEQISTSDQTVIDNPSDGVTVVEYSADLQTRYQYYRYDLGSSGNRWYAAIDQFEAVYLLTRTVSGIVSITKLSSSDAGYIPVWSRVLGTYAQAQSGVLEIMPDGRIIVLLVLSSASAVNYWFVLSADGTQRLSRTSLAWSSARTPGSASIGAIDRQKEVVTFHSGRFTIGKTSLLLPAVAVPLAVTSSTQAGAGVINGSTDYTVSSLAAGTLPSRTVLTRPARVTNPMVLWGEAAWSITDLTATVQHNRVCTGPLVVPPAMPAPEIKPPLIDLLLEGSNNSTIFTDSSTYNRTPSSVIGSTVISTAQAPVGSTSSMSLPSSISRLQYSTAPELVIGNAYFEFRFDVRLGTAAQRYLTSLEVNGSITGAAFPNFGILISSSYIGFANPAVNIPYAFALNTWHRIRVARFQQQIRIVVNGVQIAQFGNASNWTGGYLTVGNGCVLPFANSDLFMDNYAMTIGGILEPWPA